MSSARRKWIAGFYWIGVVMVLATIGVVVAGHTERFGLLERINFPVTGACAAVAVVALLAAELCHSLASSSGPARDRTAQPREAELEAAKMPAKSAAAGKT